ncbi:MAG: hypothetical protein ACK4XM_07315 [Chloroherpetonaceae bacterium]
MARSNLNLLLLVSGNGAKILQANGLSQSETDIIKIDEKAFASPKNVLRLARAKPYQALYFGCDRLWAHRFGFIQKAFIALTTRRGGIIDEIGTRSSYKTAQFLLVETPLFIWEVLVSTLVVVWFHIQIFLDKRALCNSRR